MTVIVALYAYKGQYWFMIAVRVMVMRMNGAFLVMAMVLKNMPRLEYYWEHKDPKQE